METVGFEPISSAADSSLRYQLDQCVSLNSSLISHTRSNDRMSVFMRRNDPVGVLMRGNDKVGVSKQCDITLFPRIVDRVFRLVINIFPKLKIVSSN